MTDARNAASAVISIVERVAAAVQPYTAVVTAVTPSAVQIRLPEADDGDDEEYARLAGAHVAVGDRVLVLNVGGTPCILDRIKRAPDDVPSLVFLTGNAGVGATSAIVGNDTSGRIEIVTGSSGEASGVLVRFNFASVQASGHYAVLLTPASQAAANLQGQYNVTNRMAGGWDLNLTVAPTTSTTYIWCYRIDPYEVSL